MLQEDRHFRLRLATDEADRIAAMRLRYRVFVAELGADGAGVDHEGGTESDAFDAYYDQLVLVDTRRDPSTRDHVVGVYRLLRGEVAAANAGFYSQGEYDLSALIASGRRLLELGRSCVDREYRGGTAMYHLWNGLAAYVLEHDIEVLFGVASFHGTDVAALAQPLAYLHHHHLAPPALRVRARPESFARMDALGPEEVDRVAAMRAMPALIKAYLRLGGFVGEGAYVDHAFNTTDVCLLMDTGAMSVRHRGFYQRQRPAGA